IKRVLGTDYGDEDPVLRPSQFGDVQANVALALSKRVGRAPRDIAASIVQELDLARVCATPWRSAGQALSTWCSAMPGSPTSCQRCLQTLVWVFHSNSSSRFRLTTQPRTSPKRCTLDI